uniref:C1q domain-containing protein n=1 Tax=Magallana gigas TaxID=29159 RepID=A0A8W8M0G8_MAGGI
MGTKARYASCTVSVIAFHASLRNHLRNVPVNTIIKFEKVHLNKGNGYDPATGVFTAPENGVYSFAWSFLTSKGGNVYLAAVVDNQVQAKSSIEKHQSAPCAPPMGGDEEGKHPEVM